MRRRLVSASVFSCALGLILTIGAAEAGIITWTGSELDSQASWHPSATHVVNGTSVDTTSGGSPLFTKLFEIRVLSAGESDSSALLNISADMTRLTDDSDFTLGLTDGTNFFTFIMADNNGGNLDLLRFTDSNNDDILEEQENLWSLLGSGTGMPAIGGDYSGSMSLSSSGGDTVVSGDFGTKHLDHTWVGFDLDWNSDIYLIGVSNHPDIESYRINNISFAVIPEPSTALLLGIGLSALAVTRSRG